MPSDFQIYNVSIALQDLMARRDDLTNETIVSTEQSEANKAALAALDVELRTFLHSELVRDKIDGLAGFLRADEARSAEIRREAKRLIAHADVIDARDSYFKGVLLQMMITAKLPRLEGRNSVIRRQNSGGKLPVVVSAPALLPEEFATYEARISGPAHAALKQFLPSWLGREDVRLERKHMLNAIAAALEEPCPTCDGTGGCGHPGRVGAYHQSERCPDCDGSGKRGVPGAAFGPRGEKVVVA